MYMYIDIDIIMSIYIYEEIKPTPNAHAKETGCPHGGGGVRQPHTLLRYGVVDLLAWLPGGGREALHCIL